MPALRESLDLCRKGVPGLIAFWLALSITAANADDGVAGQRFQFLAAEQALQSGDREAFQTLLAELRDYPLYPYLLFDDLQQRLADNPANEVKRFLRDFADTPLASRLEREWLQSLYRQRRWQTYLEHASDDDSLERNCNRRHALLELGRRSEALADMKSLWLHGFSLPDSCDHALAVWADSGAITSELAWKRIGLAMDEGNPGLARYLGRYLPAAQRPVVDRWYALYRDPDRLPQAEFDVGTERAREIAFNVAQRLARHDPHKSAALWETLTRRFDFDREQQHTLRRRIALSFAYAGDPEALQWFADIPADQTDRYVRYWRVRAALAQQDWSAVLHWIGQLTPGEQAEERWQYWRARALEATGNSGEARALYSKVANARSYEGFLAADRAQVPYALKDKPLQFSAEQIQQFASRPAMRRAHELLQLDRKLDARREWYAAMQPLDERELQLAARLAHQWSWHDRAILTVSRAEYWDDLELRFPLPHLQAVRSISEAAGIDEAWTYAVIRRESAFNTDAYSHRGAVGLMQLLPSTARHVARAIDRRLRAVAELYQAEVNIRYGTAYLRMIMERFGDHPVLATAAYNAGPYRVQTWLPKQQSIPADIWVETVPYSETRDYLRNVLAYTAIYERRMGRKATPLEQRMPPVHPRSEKDRRADASN